MGKILGLDLGSNSIGWAIVDKDNQCICKTGVRIFQEGVVDQGTKKEKSKNAARRENRQIRRQHYRKRLRKIKLLEALIKHDMVPLSLEELKKWKHFISGQPKVFPKSKPFVEWLKMSPYDLRHRALDEDLNRHELGRIFYHFIQRRGFKSSRKGNNKDEKGKIYKGKDSIKGIDESESEKKEYRSFGDYLYSKIHKEGEVFSNKYDRARARFTLRDWYVEEFEKIWIRQAAHLGLDNQYDYREREIRINNSKSSSVNRKINSLKSRGIDFKIVNNSKKIIILEKVPLKEFFGGKDGIIFFQRPLRSQRHLLKKCDLETDKRPVPISHPIFEYFRSWQFINNIKHGSGENLLSQEKEEVFNILNSKEKSFNFKVIADKINNIYGLDNFNYDDDYKVTPNKTLHHLKKIFGEKIFEDEEKMIEIWHCLYFYDNEELLLKKMHKCYGLDEKKLELIKKIHLADDKYAKYSLKAIRNILPFLEHGYNMYHATLLGGMVSVLGREIWLKISEDERKTHIEKVVLELNKPENSQKGGHIEAVKNYLRSNFPDVEQKKMNKKLYNPNPENKSSKLVYKLEGIENLRNPIVQTAMCELRKLINMLINENLDKGERFEEIKVELARELKQSSEVRQNNLNENNKRRDANEDAKDFLEEMGCSPTRENIQKYILFKEISERNNGVAICPYTGKTISQEGLFSKNSQFQIEHIFPKSWSHDDSMANKTLCEVNTNREKTNMTPYEYFCDRYDKSEWEKVKDRVFHLLPYHKAKRFTKEKVDKRDFISRQLNDTRYISRKAKEILSTISESVNICQGSVTSYLRHLWGLNSILAPHIKGIPKSCLDEYPEKAGKVWIDLTDDNTVKYCYKSNNQKPESGIGQIVLRSTEKNKLTEELRKKGFSIETEVDRNSWIVVSVKNEILQLCPVWRKIGNINENTLRVYGNIKGVYGNIKEGKFNYKNARKDLSLEVSNKDNGPYFMFAPILHKRFYEKGKEPKKREKEEMYFWGKSDGSFFTSNYLDYKYSLGESVNVKGKACMVVTLDMDKKSFERRQNKAPETNQNEILVKGYFNNKKFIPSSDKSKAFSTSSEVKGEHWAVLELSSNSCKVIPIERKLPKDKKSLVPGYIKENKEDGTLTFEPDKNRADHRHHAVDALVIALMDQRVMQKLSTWNGKLDEHEKNSAIKPKFDEPWRDFLLYAKKSIEDIIISHRYHNPVMIGNAVRGQLHKEYYYGKYGKAKNSSQFHIRKNLNEIKKLNKVVDENIKRMLQERLKENNKKFKNAFFKDGEPLIFLPNKNGDKVPVRKVRIAENFNLVQIGQENRYVNPRNNHHVIIYKDNEGKLKEETVSFWEAVRRKQKGEDIIQLPIGGKEIITSMEENQMFILNSSEKEFSEKCRDLSWVSRHLYRVQTLSSRDYKFRLHTESTLHRDKNPYCHRVTSMKNWLEVNPFKVHISRTGLVKMQNA